MLEVRAEGVIASLHLDGDNALWVRSEDDKPLFVRVGEAAVVSVRAKIEGPFILAGAFESDGGKIRAVRVESGGLCRDAEVSDSGWLCLAPSTMGGQVIISIFDDSGIEPARIHTTLRDAGTLGPTFYAPPSVVKPVED